MKDTSGQSTNFAFIRADQLKSCRREWQCFLFLPMKCELCDIKRWLARLLRPLFFEINVFETEVRKSDCKESTKIAA